MNKKELETKYLKVLTTKDQREVIVRAMEEKMGKYGVKEGRALELICANSLNED
jgi:hypothetical protein